MKYIGNKNKLMPWINKVLNDEGIEIKNKLILDGFLGTGAFSKYAFEKKAKKIYGCELLTSMCFYSNYNVYGISKESFEKVKASFLKKKENKAYFYKNFSTDSKRNFFSNDNAKKIDSMLEDWETFTDIEKGLAIDMIDKVSNTSGTYGAYLKIWRSMALKNIEDYKINNFEYNDYLLGTFESLNMSIIDFNKKVDIAYLDPPYNTRQYGANYHLLERIIDRKEGIQSISGVFKTDSNSDFSKKTEHKKLIIKLIDRINSKIIIVSYNNEGIISLDEWREILKDYNFKIYQTDYKRFKSNSITKIKTKNNENLRELLFIIWK